MSWPLTIPQTFAGIGLVLLICAIVFAEMCQRAIDESFERGDLDRPEEADDAAA